MASMDIDATRIFLEFLETLSAAQKKSLACGKLHLCLADADAADPPPAKPAKADPPDISAICAQLETLPNVSTATAYITGLKPKKALLEAIAKHYSVHITSKNNIKTITDRIVENVIGHKVRTGAIFETRLG